MIPSLETAMSSPVLLSVILIQGVFGTFFPPVSNPPPVPGQAVKTVDTSPQQFFVQEDFPREIQQPLVKEGLFPADVKTEEQRWYLQENPSGDASDVQASIEAFERLYPNGEPAIGPVATPMPDDTYLAQPSSISKVNPNEAINSGSSDIWVLTRGSENQYVPERWVQIQVPSERFIEVLNRDSGSVLSRDAVKSVAPPLPPAVPVKSQFTSDTPASIIQQVWVRNPNVISSQNSYLNPGSLVEEVPSVKQVVEIPQTSVKQVVQQQITKDTLAIPPPPPPAVVSKSSFTLPPPPPPPLKGVDVSPKIVSSVPVSIVSDGNVLASDKNGLLPQMRHIWVPTSSRTGKFISVPVASAVDPGKSVVNKGIPSDPTLGVYSDTWVLKQEGPVPSFEQQKSAIPQPVVQGGKVVFQDSPVDAIPAPPFVAQFDSPKNEPFIGKSVNPIGPVDIWPPRRDISSTKVLEKSSIVIPPKLPPLSPPPETETVVLSKSFPSPNAAPQKTLLTGSKIDLFSSQPPAIQVVNGKPCPLPPPLPQKSLFPPPNAQVISVPRVIATQRRQPLTRIIRLNRYPSGGYYLLNSRIRPNIFNYPNPAFIRQSTPRLIRLIQSKQMPIQIQSKPVIPVQTKQITIPVQSKTIPAPIPARQVAFPFAGRQMILPISTGKSQSRIIYPGVQAVRYAYPWNAFLNTNPIPGKGVLISQSSPIKKASSESSSSESSSSESSEESKEVKSKKEKNKKEEKGKKEENVKVEEKSKMEEKPQSEESTGSDERERETLEEPESKPAESEESVTESPPKESIETAESLISQTQENLAVLTSSDDGLPVAKKPYIFRFDHRDGNGTIQHRQETSDAEGRVTGTYGYQDPEGVYRIAKYIADSDGFRVNLESNEPGTVTHESAHVNFISNQVTGTEEKPRYETSEATDAAITTDFQRD